MGALGSHVIKRFPAPVLSVVILTFNNSELFAALLRSIAQQKSDFNYELIIADNGCHSDTKEMLGIVFGSSATYSYLPLCDNPGYSAANNVAVKQLVSKKAKWVLFLNDDVRLMDGFLQSMVNLGEQIPNVGAVGCKLLSGDGSELIEAGSIIWNDGSCAGFGRGRHDIGADEFSYARPVDYVSGACLMVDRVDFLNYGGFDGKSFSAYYEDTDLQMHINHDLGKQVWFQPLAVAFHSEHASFGSGSVDLMRQGRKTFAKKWELALQEHMPHPGDDQLKFLQASDIRGRTSGKGNILYVDEHFAAKNMGSGFGRAFDNLVMLSHLGYRVTASALHDEGCDEFCFEAMRQSGVDVSKSTAGSLQTLLDDRHGFYQVIIVSRPKTFEVVQDLLLGTIQSSNCSLIYDAEAVAFRRDMKLLDLFYNEKIPFPGAFERNYHYEPLKRLRMISRDKHMEIASISKADVVITASTYEKDWVVKLVKAAASPKQFYRFLSSNVYTIGHGMDSSNPTSAFFEDRNGIMFLASFNKNMYYNGDAIWYFLEYIYPLILQEADIPLIIAGKNIPEYLYGYVARHSRFSHLVSVLESPPDIETLHNNARVFIAPHLYGAGVQFKLSEAFAAGIPVVLSSDAARNMGIPKSSTACVGETAVSFKKCVITVHNNASYWRKLRGEGLKFVRNTHKSSELSGTWALAVESAMRNLGNDKSSRGAFTKTLSHKMGNSELGKGAGRARSATGRKQDHGKGGRGKDGRGKDGHGNGEHDKYGHEPRTVRRQWLPPERPEFQDKLEDWARGPLKADP